MLLVCLGYLGVLLISGNALPLAANHRPSRSFSRAHNLGFHFLRAQPNSHRLKRNEPDWAATLEQWSPDGVSGYIDLMSSPSLNSTASNHTLVQYTVTNGTSASQPFRKIAEMGYSQSIRASNVGMDTGGPWLMNAKSPGWGTEFWMLKSHDEDCFAGSPFATSYNVNSTGNGTFTSLNNGTGAGTEYPVTLRSPLANDKYYGTYAYCATYDPNPVGSGMTIGAAPCGRISCAPLPPPINATAQSTESPDPFVPTAPHNPDGTFAPTFFSTRPCNYMDPNCHVSQIFLYNSATGAVRPMYHTARMDSASSSTELLWKNVAMVFRQGNRRPMQGLSELDPAAVVDDPAFERQSVPQPSPLAHSPVYLGPNPEVYATATKVNVVVTSTSASTRAGVETGLASGSSVKVLLAPPTRVVSAGSKDTISAASFSVASGHVGASDHRPVMLSPYWGLSQISASPSASTTTALP